MTRNFKALGLALVAMFAMSAVIASAASAAQFHSESSSTTLSGSQVEEKETFTVNAGTTKCKVATYSGSQSGSTAESVSITPSYSECRVEPIGTATIATNGCSYTFKASSATAGTADVVCPEGKVIEVVAKALGVTKCTVKIGTQAGLTGIGYEGKGSGSSRTIHVGVNIPAEIDYTQTAGTGLGACSSGSFTNGSYTGTATVSGKNAENNATGIWVE